MKPTSDYSFKPVQFTAPVAASVRNSNQKYVTIRRELKMIMAGRVLLASTLILFAVVAITILSH